MIFNISALTLALIFLILSVISVVSEEFQSQYALPRNILRRIKITLRELTFPAVLAIAAVFWAVSLKLAHSGILWTSVVTAVFLCGYVTVVFFRSHGFLGKRRRKRKKKKVRAPAGLVKDSAETGETPLTAVLPENTDKI